MAQKVQVLLVCDLHDNDEEGTETVAFGLDGSAYEIDVCASHAEQLRDAFAPFVGAARRAGRGGTPARRAKGGRPAKSGDRVAQIREWARANGHQVNDRGRLPASVVEAYDKAN